MSPHTSTEIKGVKIETYYWAGDDVTYVDNLRSPVGHLESCSLVRRGHVLKWDGPGTDPKWLPPTEQQRNNQ